MFDIIHINILNRLRFFPNLCMLIFFVYTIENKRDDDYNREVMRGWGGVKGG